VAQSNRQKYNFLAAFVKQLDQARDEQDELAGQCDDVMGVPELVRAIDDVRKHAESLEAKYDELNQWLAQLELALEELDGDGSESAREVPEPDDDGDYDDDVERDEPEVVRPRQSDGRVARPVERAGERPLARRSVAKTLRNVRSR